MVDYSKFDKIEDSDEEKEPNAQPVTKKAVDAVKPAKCNSCGKSQAKLRMCSICKKAGYCSEQCQRSDWPYHKRVCSPVKKKKDGGVNGGDNYKKAAAKAASNASKKKAKVVEEEEEEGDSDDGAPITWYKHRETKLPPSVAGPSKLAEAPPAASSAAVPSVGSVWNTAGTWEERDVLPWVKKYLEEQFRPLTRDFGSGVVAATAVTKVDGDASVGVHRGKTRRLFDLTVEFTVEARVGGKETPYRAKLVLEEFTHDAASADADPVTAKLAFTDEAKAPSSLAREIRAHIGAGSVPLLEGLPATLAQDVAFFLRDTFLPAFMVL